MKDKALRKRLRKAFDEIIQGDVSTSLFSAFDIIGNIAVTKMPICSTIEPQQVAGAIMNRHKNVKTVFVQETDITGAFRLRGLKYVAGENNSCTVHKESGCYFMVDLQKCYFSPRLSGERIRLAKVVQPEEKIVNMFAGVGCFSIIIAYHVDGAKVYSIDINPDAIRFMTENIKLNRVYGRVIPILGDSKAIIGNQLTGCADRVLMPLPEKAFEYLPYAVSALREAHGWIHLHTFEHAQTNENPIEKSKLKTAHELRKLGADFELAFSRVVRSVGPNWYQVVLDIRIKGIHANLNNYSPESFNK